MSEERKPPQGPLDQEEISTNPAWENLYDSGEEVANATRTLRVESGTLKLRRCRISVVAGPDAGLELVSDQERIRIGAHRANDLVLSQDRAASRQHCEVHRTDRGYLLVDLDSTNGTLLEGRRIERAYLAAGSTIRAGLSTLVFTPMDQEVRVEPDREEQLGGMVGHSLQMRRVVGLIKKIAPMDVPVVIQGETGTGKELVARAIHELSARRGAPFVVLDCGAIPPSLIESELFGHERGAFTGAVASRPGAFERASGGTIFLDELGELRFDLQPKLLRVLENGELRRVGGNSLVRVDARVLAATHRDLLKETQGGQFREDLYFRLSVINIQLPSLRERPEDVLPILERTLADPETIAQHGRKRFTPAAAERLASYPWPGNVRELMNVLSHILAFSEGEEIDLSELPARVRAQVKDTPLSFNEHLSFKVAKEQLLERFECEYLTQVLNRCQGKIAKAAKESGLHRKTIERLARKYQLATRAAKRK